MIVTTPSDAILMKAIGESGACGPNCASTSTASRCSAIIMPPPLRALTRRKERREIFLVMAPPLLCRGARGLRGRQRGGLLDRLTNSRVGAAATEVAAHAGVDLRVAWLGRLGEQRRRRHDLPCLAVAALRHVHVLPRHLHGMPAVGR